MKTIILASLLIVSFAVHAQLTVTTNYREDGKWDEKAMKWDILSTEEGITILNFNNELTSFRHVTGSVSSTYSIIDWDYDDKEVLYEMDVKSDVGNEYELLIDGINEYVIFFYYDSSGSYRMIRHTIKETWFDE